MQVTGPSTSNFSPIELENFPPELQLHIFSFLDPKTIVNGISLTCKKFQVWEKDSLVNWIIKNLLDDYEGALDYLSTLMTIPSNKCWSVRFVNVQNTIRKNRNILIDKLKNLPKKELQNIAVIGSGIDFHISKTQLFDEVFFQFLKILIVNKFEFRGNPPKYIDSMKDKIQNPLLRKPVPFPPPWMKDIPIGWESPPNLNKYMIDLFNQIHINSQPKIETNYKIIEELLSKVCDSNIDEINSPIKFADLLQEIPLSFQDRICPFVHCVIEKVRSLATRTFAFISE